MDSFGSEWRWNVPRLRSILAQYGIGELPFPYFPILRVLDGAK